MDDSSDSEQELFPIEVQFGRTVNFFDYSDPCSVSRLTKAILNDDLENFQKLIRNGAEINIPDNMGNTALHIAAYFNRCEAVKWLLERDDLNINAKNHTGMTAAFVSAYKSNENILSLLIKSGADINHRTDDLEAPIHVAVRNSNLTLTELLIQNGAVLNCINVWDESLLSIAIENKNVEIVDVLLKHGADFNSSDFEYGLRTRNNFIVSSLVENIKNVNNFFSTRSYLYLVLIYCDDQIVYKLLNKGAHLHENELSATLFVSDLNMFKSIWESYKFPEYLDCMDSETSNLMKNYFSSILRNKSFKEGLPLQIIEYIIYSGPRLHLQRLISTSENNPFLGNLIEDLKDNAVEECKIIEYSLILLTNNLKVYDVDISKIYNLFGYGEFYEVMLHMDIRESSNFYKCHIIPRLMLSINLQKKFEDLVENLLGSLLNNIEEINFDNICLLKFFTFSNGFLYKTLRNNKDKLMNYLFYDKEQFSIDFFETNNFIVPSLMELTRNACRDYISCRYETGSSSQFFAILKSLNICDNLKNIISLKKPIYKIKRN